MSGPAIGGTSALSACLVTASYRGDLERCRLLCDSIDAHVRNHTCHYILVEERDRALFAPFEGPRRRVVGERDILPFWLRPVPDPIRGGRLWLHPFGLPLRGWHVQQLRRIAFAQRLGEEVMISCDSDVVFVRPFDVADFGRDGQARFYRVPPGEHAVTAEFQADHERWFARAGRLLALPDRPAGAALPGFITTVVPWRTASVRAMAERIERVTGRGVLRALASSRALSECTIYGRFVAEVDGGEFHRPTARSACRVYWTGTAMDEAAIRALIDGLDGEEVAICIQSFTRTDPALVRTAARLDR